ncbi:MAG: hypothetical protein IPG80_10855 [Anaerolineales bacterium]|uniref:hypothetical protein n=1 Tax=Candidatus Villigracilis TaxID=3140593 RepID=UPI002A1E60D0|nr:hypothetical protein [Anaerolineales bacterium]MBL0344118.1 hypothetical protein [Anaerolineales bacterium]
MRSTINGAKLDSKKMMQTIRARFGSESFGVAGFSDYGDIPYQLYQPLTDNFDSIQTVIDSLTLVDGGDIPEAYGRMMYESYSDPNIKWHNDGYRYLIIFGDSYPHDPDAGRDGILGTSDDLTFADVLTKLKANNITVIYVSDPGIANEASLLNKWQDWVKETGGRVIRCINP